MKHKKRGRFASFLKHSEESAHRFSLNEPQAMYDLSQLEDSSDRSIFSEILERAAINAVNENKAMGIPVTFMQDGWVVSRMPDGTIRKISEIETGPVRERKLTKGTILHVKKAAG